MFEKKMVNFQPESVATFTGIYSIDSSVLRFIVKTGGYAAKSIANRLKKKGGDLIMPPEGFLVTGEEGPLQEGELERAADWAKLAIKV